MDKYIGQPICHAKNGDERVFKLSNKCAYPDGYTLVPTPGYEPINGDTFYDIKEIEIDEDLELRNEQMFIRLKALKL